MYNGLLKWEYTKLKLFVFFFSLIFVPYITFAQVTLYISPSDIVGQSDNYGIGTIIPVEIILDTHEATIGVGEGRILFSPEDFEIIELSDDNSIFDLWLHELSISDGVISFAGSIQEGFSGKGEVFRIKLRAKNNLTTALLFDDVRVLTFTSQSQNILQRTQDAWYPFKIPTAIPKEFIFDKNREQGSRYLDLAYLQICLRSEEVYSEEITGFFGSKTQEALIKFQEKYFDEILASQKLQNGTGMLDEQTRSKLNQICPRELIEQLFDISFTLENLTVLESSELTGLITFENFGLVSTPINLTFVVFDEAGNEVYREMEDVIIETENVMRKRFPKLELSDGKYTLILETLYDVDVFDEFKKDFEVGVEEKNIFAQIWPWILFGLVISVILIIWKRWDNKQRV